jgi:hypothetical protein
MVSALPTAPQSIERLPPHNTDAEQGLLGSLLIDRDAIIRVASFVKPEDFYHHANGTVYRQSSTSTTGVSRPTSSPSPTSSVGATSSTPSAAWPTSRRC